MAAIDSHGPQTFSAPIDTQFEIFIDDHRTMIAESLDGLTEAQARRRLVNSNTTMLGLVKHAAFVERVWFGEAISGQSRAELGIAPNPEVSFELDEADTIESVRADHRLACEQSRRATADLSRDDLVTGNRRGPLPLRWVYLHVLRELAQHCGHADILREQLLGSTE